MHHPTDRITHTTACVTPVVEGIKCLLNDLLGTFVATVIPVSDEIKSDGSCVVN